MKEDPKIVAAADAAVVEETKHMRKWHEGFTNTAPEVIQDPGPLTHRFRFTFYEGGHETEPQTVDIMASTSHWACFTLGWNTGKLFPRHREPGFFLDPHP